MTTPITSIVNTPSAEIASKTFVASTYVPYTGATTNPNIGSYYLISSGLRANGSGGLLLESNNGTDVLVLGAGGGANATAYGGWNFDGATANTIASFGASKTLSSLSTSTYPSLTELSYVKGLSSAVQTQLNDKASLSGINTFIDENYFQQAVYFGDPGVPSSGALYLYNVPYGDYMSITTGDGGINVNGSGLTLVVGEEANLLYLTGSSSGSAQRMNTNCTAFSFEKKINHNLPTNLKNYTVATLPTGVRGDLCYCTDLLLPTRLGIATGGGAVVGLVFYDGTNWVTY